MPLLDFIIKEYFSSPNESLKQFLLFICLDHDSIIKGKKRSFLMSDYLCFYLANIISEKVQEEIKYLIMMAYLCQINRFAKYCLIKLSEGAESLKEKVQDILINSKAESNIDICKKATCLLILSILGRSEVFDQLSCFTNNNLKDTNFESHMLKTSVHPFSGIVSK